MPHHDKTLPPEDDRRIAEFLLKTYADSQQAQEPNKALRTSLGYKVESVDDLVREATSADDLSISCRVCGNNLDIHFFDCQWGTSDFSERDLCERCINRLENALLDGSITYLIADEQTPLIPGMEKPHDFQASCRMRHRYAAAMGWLDQIAAGENTDAT